MEEFMRPMFSRLLLRALDRAGVTDTEWRTSFRISPARLQRLRAEQTRLSDGDFARISRVAGEPWQALVLRLLGDDSPLTKQTRELVASLHALHGMAQADAMRQTHRDRISTSHRMLLKRLRAGHSNGKRPPASTRIRSSAA